VPGVILPLVLGGDNDDQAVYSVQMDFGHGTLDGGDMSSSKRRRRMPEGLAKRRPSSYWDGGSPQTVNLQVDLGSSDLVGGRAYTNLSSTTSYGAANRCNLAATGWTCRGTARDTCLRSLQVTAG
jgi:hypothetical protein